MHDLTYAKDIIRALSERLETLEHNTKIAGIRAAISPLSHVKAETLTNTYRTLIAGTELENIPLIISPLMINMTCNACEKDFQIEKPTFLCPSCNNPSIEIVETKEFSILSIDVINT